MNFVRNIDVLVLILHGLINTKPRGILNVCDDCIQGYHHQGKGSKNSEDNLEQRNESKDKSNQDLLAALLQLIVYPPVSQNRHEGVEQSRSKFLLHFQHFIPSDAVTIKFLSG